MVLDHPCDGCRWSDSCDEPDCCEHYDPIDGDIDAVIENERYSFREEWFDHMEELDNG